MTAPAAACSFKFIIIGSSGVGKTALLKRLVDDRYLTEATSTIGVEFDSTYVEVDGQSVKLQIWDTAGQERFRSIAKAYFRNAVGVVLVFDICEPKTFEEVDMWLREVRSLCDPTAAVMLVGNKSDLAPSRAVTLADAERFAQHNHIAYIEASAKSGENVHEAFLRTAAQIYRGRPKAGKAQGAPAANDGQKKGCCG
jgi:small GTP-binding protein